MASDTLTIQVDGAEKTLFMSYGLLDRILKLFKSEEQALMAVFDNELRNQVLQEVLKVRGAYGVYDPVPAPEDLSMTKETVTTIFKWVSDHLADFFLQGGEATKEIAEQYASRSAALQPSQIGSPA